VLGQRGVIGCGWLPGLQRTQPVRFAQVAGDALDAIQRQRRSWRQRDRLQVGVHGMVAGQLCGQPLAVFDQCGNVGAAQFAGSVLPAGAQAKPGVVAAGAAAKPTAGPVQALPASAWRRAGCAAASGCRAAHSLQPGQLMWAQRIQFGIAPFLQRSARTRQARSSGKARLLQIRLSLLQSSEYEAGHGRGR
jgi:hypothetical protein